MTLKVILLLQAFSSAIRRTFVQYFTRFELTARRAVPQRQLGFLSDQMRRCLRHPTFSRLIIDDYSPRLGDENQTAAAVKQ